MIDHPMFHNVQWEVLPIDEGAQIDGTPYATHIGVLSLAGHTLTVYQLNTGQRVFSADDLEEFFARLGEQPEQAK